MKVKAICKYHDLKLNRLVELGEEIEVTEARAKQLVKAKVAEIVEAPTPTTEKVVKKTRAKKEGAK